MAKPVVIEQRRKIHTLEDSKWAREGHSQWKTSKEDEWLFSSTQNVKQHSLLGINKEHCWLWGYHQAFSCLEITGKICSFYLRVNFLSGRQFWPWVSKACKKVCLWQMPGHAALSAGHAALVYLLFSSLQDKFYTCLGNITVCLLSFFFFFFISDRKLSIYF